MCLARLLSFHICMLDENCHGTIWQTWKDVIFRSGTPWVVLLTGELRLFAFRRIGFGECMSEPFLQCGTDSLDIYFRSLPTRARWISGIHEHLVFGSKGYFGTCVSFLFFRHAFDSARRKKPSCW